MNYSNILKEIALKEGISLALVVIILFAALTLVWVISFKSFKNNSAFKHNPTKRKNCILGLIFITVFSVALVVVFTLDTIRDLHNIHKDIEQASYITYKGNYYLATSANDVNPPAPTFIDVNLETNITLRLYVNLSEWSSTLSYEERYGEIIYGANSNIIVDILNY